MIVAPAGTWNEGSCTPFNIYFPATTVTDIVVVGGGSGMMEISPNNQRKHVTSQHNNIQDSVR